MRTLSLLALLASSQAQGGPTQYGPQFDRNCRVVASVNYTQVVDTTTRTSDASASLHTIFSTMTLINPLPMNGDSLTITCNGTTSPLAEIRTPAVTVNGVVISSRTISIGTNGMAMVGWMSNTEFVRTGASAQVRNCLTTGPNPLCTGATTSPPIGAGTNTLNETATWVITCSAANVTAGSTSFLSSKAVYCPSPL